MLGIYTRLSKEDEESNSINNQIKEGKLFAKENGFIDYKIFNEGEGISGGLQIAERPELKKLIDEIISGKISAVWFRNQNRLERNSLTFHSFVHVVRKAKIDVYFDDKLQDYNDPLTTLQSTILSGMNEYTRMLQGKQAKKVLKQRAIDGKAHGIMAYGYTTDKNGFILIDDEESKTVKRIYEMSLEGIGTNKIAEELNNDKVPTRYNTKYKGTYKVKHKFNGTYTLKEKKNVTWKGGTVRNILTNTIYKGKRKFGEDVYDVDKIVTPAYWQKVNDNLKKNRNNSGKSVKHKYLLRGKMICGKCGCNYYGRSRVNKKDHYYMCSSKRYKATNCGNKGINIDVIEDFIWQRFFADKVLKDKIIEHFSNINAQQELIDKKENLIAFEKDLIYNRETRRKTVKKAIADVISDEDAKYELDSLKKQQDTIELIIHNLKEEISALENIETNSSRIIKELDKVKKKTAFEQKKLLIEKYIETIKIKLGVRNWYVIIVSFKIPNLKREGYLLIKNQKNEYFAIDFKSGLVVTDLSGKVSKEEGLEIIKQLRQIAEL